MITHPLVRVNFFSINTNTFQCVPAFYNKHTEKENSDECANAFVMRHPVTGRLEERTCRLFRQSFFFIGNIAEIDLRVAKNSNENDEENEENNDEEEMIGLVFFLGTRSRVGIISSPGRCLNFIRSCCRPIKNCIDLCIGKLGTEHSHRRIMILCEYFLRIRITGSK